MKELEFTLAAKEQAAPAVSARKVAARRHSSDQKEEETSPKQQAENEPMGTTAQVSSRAAAHPSLAIAALEKKLQTREAAIEQASRDLSTLREDYDTLQAEFRFREEKARKQTEALRAAGEVSRETETKLASAEERVANLEEMLRRQTEALETAKHSGESSAKLMLESVEVCMSVCVRCTHLHLQDNTRLRRDVQQLQEEAERTADALSEAKTAKEELAAEASAAAKEIEQLKRCVEVRLTLYDYAVLRCVVSHCGSPSLLRSATSSVRSFAMPYAHMSKRSRLCARSWPTLG